MSNARLNLFWIIFFGATMPLAVVLSTYLARSSLEKIKLRDQTITVKGYAERSIAADRAVWQASLVIRRPALKEGYSELEQHRLKLLRFLADRKFEPEQVELSAVNISTLHPRDAKGNPLNAIEAYVISQAFTIESSDVQRIAALSREVSDLIGEGLELESSAPQYIYTKLDDLKLEMLSEASANAHDRATRLVSSSGNRIGVLRSASQGVFQITRPFSTDVSDSGVSDTSSVQKVVKAVVTAEYAIE